MSMSGPLDKSTCARLEPLTSANSVLMRVTPLPALAFICDTSGSTTQSLNTNVSFFRVSANGSYRVEQKYTPAEGSNGAVIMIDAARPTSLMDPSRSTLRPSTTLLDTSPSWPSCQSKVVFPAQYRV